MELLDLLHFNKGEVLKGKPKMGNMFICEVLIFFRKDERGSSSSYIVV